MRRTVKNALLVPVEWLGIALGVCAFYVMPHRVMLALCDVASAVMYRFDGRGRRRSLDNLRILTGRCSRDDYALEFNPDRAVYDPTKCEALVIRRSYRNMARTVGHVFWTIARAKRRVAAVGEMSSACRAFLAAHKPAVTVSAHIGCWEILSQLALLSGHGMMSVAKRIGTERMTRLLMAARRSIGQEIVLADGAFKVLMDGLRHGKSLGLLVDQAVQPKDGGVWVRFLGRAIPVSAAPAFFASKGKVPIIVAWSRPLKDGRYRCEKVDEIGEDETRDIWKTTQRCADDIARVVRRHPSCWVLNYNYFSNQASEKELAQLAKRAGRMFTPRTLREIAIDFTDGDEKRLETAVKDALRSRHDLSPLVLVVRGTAGERLRLVCERAAALCINVSVRFVDAPGEAS